MTAPETVKVLHVITGLNVGGAEMMLYKLLAHIDRKRFVSKVISLTDVGAVGERIQAFGIPVQALGMRRAFPSPFSLLLLARWIARVRPDVVQSWMYHADLVGGLATKLVRVPIVWNVRHSNLLADVNKRSTIWTARACARLSPWIPSAIIFNSVAAQKVHAAWGYVPEKAVVIPNGFDIDNFRPDATARLSLRAELGLSTDAQLVGMVARFDPQKDHQTFFRAASQLAPMGNIHFVLCGDRVNWQNPELVHWIQEAGLESVCHLLGRRGDVPRITAALDVATLSSSCGESFPNVVGEAMACGVPCVVTDVGDSAGIVGETGIVVPPRDPRALAEGWQKILALPTGQRARLGALARQRVTERYSLPHVVGEYESLYEAVLAPTRSQGGAPSRPPPWAKI